MKPLTPPELEWLALVARGSFSFRCDGESYTTAEGHTFCASTYNAMMARGWAPEVI